VLANLVLGLRPAPGMAEVEAAVAAAGAADFVADLPGGYAARVGERGSRLSGGQRQVHRRAPRTHTHT
jgi:ABC-type multidrug transport system fused ATPase/permease subunit